MKTLLNPSHVSRCCQLYEDAAAQSGIKVTIGYDFNE